MSKYELDAIIKEAEKAIKNEASKDPYSELAVAAAKKFIEVLQDEIRGRESTSGFANGKLGSTAVEALTKLEHGIPRSVGNNHQIDILFSEDLYRQSLAPNKYDGIDDIALLLDRGYRASRSIKGKWHGNNIVSVPIRAGSQFIEDAINYFMINHADDYNVENITIDED